MSQTNSDLTAEHDPLMAFLIEPGAEATGPAAPATAQPAAPTQVPAQDALDPAPTSTMVRLDQLERSLEQSRAEVEGLKSSVATLVVAISDIKKRQSRQPAVAPSAPVSPGRAPLTSAVAGVVLGVLLGAWLWMNLSKPDETAAAPPETTQSAATEPAGSAIVAAATVGPAATVVPAAAIETPAPIAPVIEQTPAPESSGPRTIRAAAPTPFFGTLSIDAEPGGEVYIDRRRVGHTPQRVANLRAGSHLVWIERDGYQRYTRVVQVPANRVSRVSVALEPMAER